jgi:periplasmic divalent cation tolerance protein
MSGHVVVMTTVAREEDASRIARSLVERGAAACVSILPGVTSVYRWKGAIEASEERLLLVKTREDRFEAVRALLLEVHPYEVPEVIALPVTGGHPPYLSWIDESVP